MKKFLVTFLVLAISILCLFAVACKEKEPLVIKESDTYIVIKVSSEQKEITNNLTLLEYMQSLKADGQLEFVVSGGMITSINNIENPSDWSKCWMLYTSDTENSNNAWGEIDYNGNIYGSANFGAERLIVKENALYIWVFKAF